MAITRESDTASWRRKLIRVFLIMLLVAGATACSLKWPFNENVRLLSSASRGIYHGVVGMASGDAAEKLFRFYGKVADFRMHIKQDAPVLATKSCDPAKVPVGHALFGALPDAHPALPPLSCVPPRVVKPHENAKNTAAVHKPLLMARADNLQTALSQPATGVGSQNAADATPSVSVPMALVALSDRADCSKGVTMNVVAHEDDDLLFLNPDLQADIAGGHCIRTVYLTAGDSGQPSDYWTGREQGAKAAYAAMFGMDDTWQDAYQEVAGKLVEVSYLKAAPAVALVFLHLPDGNIHGEGFTSTGAESLAKLLAGQIPVIHTVDNKTTYTQDQLVAVLSAIMQTDKPDHLRTQNPHGQADGDHADHEAAGTLTTLASASYTLPHMLATYDGYPDMLLSPNLTTEQISSKQVIFLTYAKHDPAVCQTPEECAATMTYGNYLTREYKLAEVSSGQPVSASQ